MVEKQGRAARVQLEEPELRQTGVWNSSHGAEAFGFTGLAGVSWNLEPALLVERALRRGEAAMSASGALVAETGPQPEPSADDIYVVRDAGADDAGLANTIAPEQFEALRQDFLAHSEGRELFAQDLYGGADRAHGVRARIFCELAWHAMFIRTLMVRPERAELASFEPELTVVDLPSFRADPERHGVRSPAMVAIDLDRRIVLIGGVAHAGALKEAVSAILNHVLPEKGVLPLRGSANLGPDGPVLFFGRSGSGKTTLTFDAERELIADGDLGWGPDGLFNLEGGCYERAIRGSAEGDAGSSAGAQRFGAILENVRLDADTREADFAAASRSGTARGAYPLNFVANASASGVAPHPKAIVMLVNDAFGVLPPLAKLTPAQAVYHFLSGYSAEPQAAREGAAPAPRASFSPGFGAPFPSHSPAHYAEMLKQLIAEHGVACWLLNTGWIGAGAGVGKRIALDDTRALLAAALDGSLDGVETRESRLFGLQMPTSAPGVDPALLRPGKAWADPKAYKSAARRLYTLFQENFARFEPFVDGEVLAGGPHSFRQAAE